MKSFWGLIGFAALMTGYFVFLVYIVGGAWIEVHWP